MIDRDNIEAAILAAAKGKRKKKSVKKALADIDRTVEFAYDLLSNDKWSPPAIRQGHYINDGIKAKKRLIIHPSFTEQVIHHCYVDNILEPIFSRRFIRWNCGTVPKRGQEEMARHLMKFLRNKPNKAKYYAKLDIKKCFDSADTDAVYGIIEKAIRDKWILGMTRKILDSNRIMLPDGEIREGGIPIGLYTSPWFVNIALDELDHYFTDDCGVAFYVRFMDDILIIHPNKRKLNRFIEGAGEWMGRLGFRWKEPPKALLLKGKIRFTGFQFDKESIVVRDQVFVRARRLGRRLVQKEGGGGRITAFDAQRLISHYGRFLAFEQGHAFFETVCQSGKIGLSRLRKKVSERDKLKNRSGK